MNCLTLRVHVAEQTYFGLKVIPFWVFWGQSIYLYTIWVHGPSGNCMRTSGSGVYFVGFEARVWDFAGGVMGSESGILRTCLSLASTWAIL